MACSPNIAASYSGLLWPKLFSTLLDSRCQDGFCPYLVLINFVVVEDRKLNPVCTNSAFLLLKFRFFVLMNFQLHLRKVLIMPAAVYNWFDGVTFGNNGLSNGKYCIFFSVRFTSFGLLPGRLVLLKSNFLFNLGLFIELVKVVYNDGDWQSNAQHSTQGTS